VGAGSASAQVPSPAAAFLEAWAKIDGYTVTIAVHETAGNDVQDRVYRYSYKKPHEATIEVLSGPGRGSGATWTGGDRVSGHQGGLLSAIRLSVPITDARATSLRGDTIDFASFQSIADELAGGRVEPATGPNSVGGVACDDVTMIPAAPVHGVTRHVVCFARTTHLPLRRTGYAGDAPVKVEEFREFRKLT
jgi:hypothetical protein